ncbi:hypothetical protein VNO78_06710 [Psophocarpus tetragonolobus]|uniref:UBA domain-containing protein n=1 Tax=Psophocarpus tetragonolobus TaxID=3891 RepID=A0AAN9XRR3_PSOTE
MNTTWAMLALIEAEQRCVFLCVYCATRFRNSASRFEQVAPEPFLVHKNNPFHSLSNVPAEENSNRTRVKVAQLVSMGFNHLHCQKATINTSNVGIEEPINWLLSHMEDPVPAEENSNKTRVRKEIVMQLVSMDFNHLHHQKAAINTSNLGVEEVGYYLTWMIQAMVLKP